MPWCYLYCHTQIRYYTLCNILWGLLHESFLYVSGLCTLTTHSMNILTLCYSNHRPETLAMVTPIIEQHDAVFLEEPHHERFQAMLRGDFAIDELLLELDLEYPLFTRQYYKMLQRMAFQGKDIIQIEPFMDYLLQIHSFFAEGHAPEELDNNTILYDVYIAERNATGRLLAYYKASRASNFDRLLQSMQEFAKTDAQRFKLRDRLRADAIIDALKRGCDSFVEAGNMHQYLHSLLKKHLPQDWELRVHRVEQEIAAQTGLMGTIMSPGDELTLAYVFGTPLKRIQENLLCAQSLIYAKIIHKEEVDGGDQSFPHVRDELRTINTVNTLSLDDCRKLYFDIFALPTHKAQEVVRGYLQRKI